MQTNQSYTYQKQTMIHSMNVDYKIGELNKKYIRYTKNGLKPSNQQRSTLYDNLRNLLPLGRLDRTGYVLLLIRRYASTRRGIGSVGEWLGHMTTNVFLNDAMLLQEGLLYLG